MDSDETHERTESHLDDPRDYLTSVKLAMVISAVTLVCFLVFLDTSIIVIVSFVRNY